MPLKSQLPRRSRRQQGHSPELEDSSHAESVTNRDTQHIPPSDLQQNQMQPPVIETIPNLPFHQPNPIPMYGTTMSHDRTHFIPNVHAMAHTINPQIMQQVLAQSSHAFHNPGHAMAQSSSSDTSTSYSFAPTQRTIISDAIPKDAASTNSIINNAENIIRQGNQMQSSLAQGGNISTTQIPTPAQSIHTNMDSSIPSRVTPPMPHINIPQLGFYPQAHPSYYPSHPAPNAGSLALLEQLSNENKKLQEHSCNIWQTQKNRRRPFSNKSILSRKNYKKRWITMKSSLTLF